MERCLTYEGRWLFRFARPKDEMKRRERRYDATSAILIIDESRTTLIVHCCKYCSIFSRCMPVLGPEPGQEGRLWATSRVPVGGAAIASDVRASSCREQ
ncbi:hypothetical protein AVEN_2721-1 [Araneus ventricosus]|uniref:Uncharacterized protein n=1 Tax=Araneus ventricosus TaxID=182803 RepID=A0A4Y2KAT2_ARAVE|nr:hypothetical protein AVEN_2721-1 [Araneus ventricosus]